MVEAVSQPRAGGGASANDASNDQNSFHIIHNFFRERFFKYFEMIHSKSYLIIEESLFPVILFLLSPIPEGLGVVKYDILTDQIKLQGPVLKERNDTAV